MGGLKQVHAVIGDSRRHTGNIVRTVEPLAEAALNITRGEYTVGIPKTLEVVTNV